MNEYFISLHNGPEEISVTVKADSFDISWNTGLLTLIRNSQEVAVFRNWEFINLVEGDNS